MSETDYISIIIAFVGGLGLFIYGMHIMAEGLQKACGERMKKLLEVLTSNRLMGVIVGTFVTGIIQSSSATTVMVVGFVNAGLMNLSQATGVIMGANIGTTVTSWLVSSVEWAKYLKPDTMAPVAIAVGVVILLTAKKKTNRHIAEIIIGFGILFIGIETMSSAVYPLRNSALFRELFITLGSNPLYGILAGAAVTAIIQSSSASVGILQTLAGNGLVPWNAAVFIIMGQNIGTCVTAILSSIGANKNAKSAAYIHLLFNVIGSVVFSIAAIVFFRINVTIGGQLINRTEISLIHTAFNVANTLLLFNFPGVLITLAKKMAKVDDSIIDESEFVHLDDRMLETPGFAVINSIKEVVRMGNLIVESMEMSLDALLNNSEESITKILARENTIDTLTDGITKYLVKICNTPLNESETNTVISLLGTVGDMERVGDHLENIAELSQYIIDNKVAFTDEAKVELKEIIDIATICFKTSVKSLELSDKIIADKVYGLEDRVDELEKRFRAAHIQRLAKSMCNSTASIVFLDTLTNIERIADHAQNIADSVSKKKPYVF